MEVGGSYTVQFSDAQMSCIAVDLDLVQTFTPMSADEVYELSADEVYELSQSIPRRNDTLWLEYINEEITETDLDLASGIKIVRSECTYLGKRRSSNTPKDAVPVGLRPRRRFDCSVPAMKEELQ